MITSIDFYAPYRMPGGRFIYGAAAANRRVAEAGGHNKFALAMVEQGVRMGYQKALVDMARQGRR